MKILGFTIIRTSKYNRLIENSAKLAEEAVHNKQREAFMASSLKKAWESNDELRSKLSKSKQKRDSLGRFTK
jgi:hypothetical protein|nr:MAG TPA: hypothetical protein [Caudoviricetes sp.]